MKPYKAIFIHNFDLETSRRVTIDYYNEMLQYAVEVPETFFTTDPILKSFVHELFTEEFFNELSLSREFVEDHGVDINAVMISENDFKRLLNKTCGSDPNAIHLAVILQPISVKFVVHAPNREAFNALRNSLKLRNIYIEEFDAYTDVTDIVRQVN